jgi:hypothetical protein
MIALTLGEQQKNRVINDLNVTNEQIGMCHEVIGPDNKSYYLVENSKGLLDENGNILEYRVSWSRTMGYQCQCEAGKWGFAHCKNFCWHVRATVAAGMEKDNAFSHEVPVSVEPTEEVTVKAAQPVQAPKKYTLMRGYDIRIKRIGERMASEIIQASAPDGELPAEWQAVKNDATVSFAQIYRNTQRQKRADKRIIADQFSR